jgi:protein-arginine kinase activator protein McsA
MLCCLCKEREAKVHIKQFVGDEPIEANLTVKIDLCEDCAKKYSANDHDGFSMADLITAVKNAQRE